MTKISEKVARLPKNLVQMTFSFGAIALVGLLNACTTSKTGTSTVDDSVRPVSVASTTSAQPDYMTNPVDTAVTRTDGKPGLTSRQPSAAPNIDALTEGPDAARPWVALKSIGFFYNRADLAAWEAIKIKEIVDYIAQHPGVEVGINRPAEASDADLVKEGLGRQRVSTIYDALIAAGVTAARIHMGTYVDIPPSLDQRIEVFSRPSL